MDVLKTTGLSIKYKETVILNPVSLNFHEKTLSAIMGPSGSAKTTLLNALSGRTDKNLEVLGHVKVLGSEISKNTRKLIGYVEQNNLFHDSLTVYETLYYTAKLKINISEKELIEKIDNMISILKLESCKDNQVGNDFSPVRISGGEKKRLAIGVELISMPKILLLDEPTSGLDSTIALQVIHSLKEYTQLYNITVISSIHQPSSHVFSLFEKVVLLTGGRLLYDDTIANIVPYFEKHNYRLPYDMNLPEFIVDISNGMYKNKKIDTTPLIKNTEEIHKDLDIVVDNPVSEKVKFKRENSYFKEFSILFKRTFLLRFRKSNDLFDVFQLLFVTLLMGLLWLNSSNVEDLTGYLFFLLLFLSFRALFEGLMAFPIEYNIIKRERSKGLFRLSNYYLTRTLSTLPIDITLPTIMITVSYFMVGLERSFTKFLLTWIFCIMNMLIAQSWGLLIGSKFPMPKMSQSNSNNINVNIYVDRRILCIRFR